MNFKSFIVLMLVFMFTLTGLIQAGNHITPEDVNVPDLSSFKLCIAVDQADILDGQLETAAVFIKVGSELFSYQYFEPVSSETSHLLSMFSNRPETADRLMDLYFAGEQEIEVVVMINNSQLKTTTFKAMHVNNACINPDNYSVVQAKESFLFSGAAPILGEDLYQWLTVSYSAEIKDRLINCQQLFNEKAVDAAQLQDLSVGLFTAPMTPTELLPDSANYYLYPNSCYDVNHQTCTKTFWDTVKVAYGSWYITASRYFGQINSQCMWRKSYRRTVTIVDVYNVDCGSSSYYCEYPPGSMYEYKTEMVPGACP